MMELHYIVICILCFCMIISIVSGIALLFMKNASVIHKDIQDSVDVQHGGDNSTEFIRLINMIRNDVQQEPTLEPQYYKDNVKKNETKPIVSEKVKQTTKYEFIQNREKV